MTHSTPLKTLPLLAVLAAPFSAQAMQQHHQIPVLLPVPPIDATSGEVSNPFVHQAPEPQAYQQRSYAYQAPEYQQDSQYVPPQPYVRAVQPNKVVPQTYAQPNDSQTSYQAPAGNYGVATDAAARMGWYGSLRGEYVMLDEWDYSFNRAGSNFSGQTDFDGGYGIGLAVGYQFDDSFRGEFEYTYRENDTDTSTLTQTTGGVVVGTVARPQAGALETSSFMLNGYVDLPIESMPALSPYVGVGMGWLTQHNGNEEDALAYQGMLGARYFVSDQAALNLEYRYFDTRDLIDNPTLGTYSPQSHIIGAGVQVYF